MQIGAAKPADGSAGRDGYRRRGETDGGGNARRLGMDPAFDQKVMTALMSDDMIDSSTGKYVLYGSYGDLDKFRKLEGITGVQLHHLNSREFSEKRYPIGMVYA